MLTASATIIDLTPNHRLSHLVFTDDLELPHNFPSHQFVDQKMLATAKVTIIGLVPKDFSKQQIFAQICVSQNHQSIFELWQLHKQSVARQLFDVSFSSGFKKVKITHSSKSSLTIYIINHKYNTPQHALLLLCTLKIDCIIVLFM